MINYFFPEMSLFGVRGKDRDESLFLFSERQFIAIIKALTDRKFRAAINQHISQDVTCKIKLHRFA